MRNQLKILTGFVLLIAGNAVKAEQPPAATVEQTALPATRLNFELLDAQVESARREWGVPGVAIAIIVDGKIAHRKGFGVRNTKTNAPVDADTVFAIASLTKSFAAATVGQMVETKQISWDDPVVTHLPWFALYDETISSKVSVRDLLAMRTGISESTNIFRAAARDRADLVRRMRQLRPLAPFRDQMIYSTDNYTAAGLVVETVGKAPWEVIAKGQIWDKLGMTRTNADHVAAQALPNSASPHLRIDGTLQPVPWIYEDHAAVPAGGMNSSANDMARWVETLLAGGSWQGKSIVPKNTIREMMTPQTLVRDAGFLTQLFGEGKDGLRNLAYGLGLNTQEYRGVPLISHGGTTDGFRSTMTILPDQKFGMVVLTNSPHELFGVAISQAVVDRILGVTGKNWSVELLEYEKYIERETVASEKADLAKRNPVSPPLAHSVYIGRYRDGGSFGEVEVKADSAGKLIMDVGRFRFDLKHWQRDSFAAVRRWSYPTPRAFFASFIVDENRQAIGIKTSHGDDFVRVQQEQ